MARPVLPKTFLDNESILLDVAEEGFTVGVPYIHEATGETKYKIKTCMGVGELSFYIDNLEKEVRALRDEEAMKQ